MDRIAGLLVCGVKGVREVEATFDFLVMLVDSVNNYARVFTFMPMAV